MLLTGLVWSSGTSASAATDRPHHGYSRAQAEKLLAQVQQALAPEKASARRAADPAPRRDLGLLLHRLQVAKGALSKADQATAQLATSRPVPASEGCVDYTPFLQDTWTAQASAHFCLHYRLPSTNNAGAATQAWANTTLSVLEHVYATEVTGLGYRKPLDDGDHLDDVFLDQIGDQGYYGFCTTDDGTSTSTAWCELDNDFAQSEFGAPPANSLRVTAAHEFFHAIQFAYDANDSTWFLEGTAVWMEDQVYPTINDYLQYLTYSQITQSEVPIDTTGTFERYGAVIFWKYLSEGYHNVDLIRRIWAAAAVSAGSRNGIQSAIAVLRYEHIGFAGAFARFSVWNTLPSGSYADRKLFPQPVPWGKQKLTTSSRDTGSQSISLDHLSSANVTLIPSGGLPTRSRLTITVDTPSRYVGQARIQVRRLDGTTIYTTMTLNSSGNGSHSIYFSGQSISSVRVTLANVSVTGNNKSFVFRARVTLP